MKNVFATLIISSLLAAAPVMAADNEAPLPKSLTDLGITSQDLNDVQESIVDQPTDSEMNMLQRLRYCPRGYILQAFRIRIGRFVIVRYRCVRIRRYPPHYPPHYPYSVQEPSVQEPSIQQNVD